ncbi:PREDICTED: putative F-box/kelch-repeat protein At5g28160 [Camelina sativa]|uniref:F-box/kelch-repeat protein At5g28160 n=1 Tax=Camelina sativa TaxID=90675 RepID=A0ABM1R2M9_CAMSA|nr:PREDICTED: putative F-box/kelch-repeat protein At5g28160 [Camelina sativa]
MKKPMQNHHMKKKKRNSPSFLSLPDEIILNCLARISRSYNPKLALVCKTFRSLNVSHDLSVTRRHLKTGERFFHVCLQKFPNDPCPSWFTLWIKHGEILTNQLGKNKTSTRNIQLVQTPSSYFYFVPMCFVSVGSEKYGLSQSNTPSSTLWILNKKLYVWQKASSMTVARKNPLACALNGKLYVMGGCTADESKKWGEVFDPKTQSWEPLHDPSPELRFSSIRNIKAIQGNLYVRSNEKKDSVYDPETEWREVKGLAMLINYGIFTGLAEIADYGGKLLILWDEILFGQPGCKHIWCAMIALKRSRGTIIDEVWGNIEWADIVHTVPSSYVFVRSLLRPSLSIVNHHSYSHIN